jgi:hypothetical protein
VVVAMRMIMIALDAPWRDADRRSPQDAGFAVEVIRLD